MGYELEILHPATAQWLTDNGYEYQHEVRMPYHGRADFVATKGGEMLVVEVKDRPLGSALRQVVDYAHQLDTSYIAIAVPSHEVDSHHIETCLRRGVRLIQLDVPKSEHPQRIAGDVFKDAMYNKLRFLEHLRSDPCETYRDIVRWHEESRTSPVFDLMFCLSYTSQPPELIEFLTDFLDTHPQYKDEYRAALVVYRGVKLSYLINGLVGRDVESPNEHAKQGIYYQQALHMAIVQNKDLFPVVGLTGNTERFVAYDAWGDTEVVGKYVDKVTNEEINIVSQWADELDNHCGCLIVPEWKEPQRGMLESSGKNIKVYICVERKGEISLVDYDD